MASLNTVAPFTAISAIISFGGVAVGSLQSVSWDENNNYRRVNAIGSPIDVIHVPGVAQYNISARRALLETELLFDILYNPRKNSDIVTTNKLANITRENLLNLLISGQGTLDTNDKILNIYYDVQIQNGDGQVLFTFEECSMNTRRASMDTGGVITYSDIQMFSRKKRIIPNSTTPELESFTGNV